MGAEPTGQAAATIAARFPRRAGGVVLAGARCAREKRLATAHAVVFSAAWLLQRALAFKPARSLVVVSCNARI